MNKYLLTFRMKNQRSYNDLIKADSKDEALEKFYLKVDKDKIECLLIEEIK